MVRLSFLLILVLTIACNDNRDKKEPAQQEDESVFKMETFTEKFKTVSLPFSLADSALLQNKDTATIRSATFLHFIPDSISAKLFGKGGKPKYTPLYKIAVPKRETYYIIKAGSGNRRAALVMTFDKQNNIGAVFPFLVADTDPATTQTSTMDKNFSITRNVSRKMPDDVIVEGKDVYVYSPEAKQFSLIMTDLLDEQNVELINPIDTLSKKHKLSGDYGRSKTNIVSIRDARSENEFLFFVHFEKDDGDCIGELKGTALMTSSNTAVYRQGGDPCVVEFHFSPSSVSLKEVEGCGSHRGLRCLFEGTFTRKKEPKPKEAQKKGKKGKG